MQWRRSRSGVTGLRRLLYVVGGQVLLDILLTKALRKKLCENDFKLIYFFDF